MVRGTDGLSLLAQTQPRPMSASAGSQKTTRVSSRLRGLSVAPTPARDSLLLVLGEVVQHRGIGIPEHAPVFAGDYRHVNPLVAGPCPAVSSATLSIHCA